MEPTNLNDSSGILVGLIFTTITILFAFQQLVKAWKSNNTESGLIKMMQEELARMNLQNTALSHEIGSLQTELIRLSQQLTDLTIENQKLQLEISMLNKEIARLHMLMSEPAKRGS
jgi:peptidoglycan hydrolase CwlO-like protein